jgi:ankyrin repeat protein
VPIALCLAFVAVDQYAHLNAPTRALFVAVKRGDVTAVKQALAMKGVVVDSYDYPEADSPLMIAANSANVPLMRLLLDRGADPNYAPHSRYHLTPLYMALAAARGGKDKPLPAMHAAIELLVARGAKVDARLQEGEFMPTTTVLLIAARLMPQTLALLAKHGDVNAVDSRGEGALVHAMRAAAAYDEKDANERLDAVLASGLKPVADLRAWALVYDASYFVVAARLRESGFLPAANSSGATEVLAMAAAKADRAGFDAILKRGVDAHAENAAAVLAAAVGANEPSETAKALIGRALDLGVPVDHANARGVRPSMLAAEGGGAWILRELLRRGADASAKDGAQNGLLHYAARSGSADVVAQLAALDPTAVNEGRATALDVAARAGHAAAVRALLPRSAPGAAQAAADELYGEQCRCCLKEARGDPRATSRLLVAAGADVARYEDKIVYCPSVLRPEILLDKARRAARTGGDLPVTLQALILGGDRTDASAWLTSAQALLAANEDWIVPFDGFPQRTQSDRHPGLNPGFDVVLMGLCPPALASIALGHLRGLSSQTYAREVQAPASAVACPIIAGGVVMTKAKLLADGNLTVAIVRNEKARRIIAQKIAGGVVTVAPPFDLAPAVEACERANGYEERIDEEKDAFVISAACAGTRIGARVPFLGAPVIAPR